MKSLPSILKILGVLVITGMLMSACDANGAVLPVAITTPSHYTLPTPQDSGQIPPAAALAAQKDLAGRLNLPIDQITIAEVQSVEWPDLCLGAPKPEEMCAQIVTSGYNITLTANGQSYSYHTDLTGQTLRQADNTSQTPAAPAGDQYPSGILMARETLAGRLNVSQSDLRITRYEKVDWPDSCLGVSTSGTICLMVVTPGYRIFAQQNGQSYEIHTTLDGSQVILAQSDDPTLDQTVLTWTSPDSPCQTVEISLAGVASGACGETLTPAIFPSTGRPGQLDAFLADYASFSADTPAGKIVFVGRGKQTASPAQQRSMAEWAALVSMEAAGGRTGAAWGLAIGWHREGGIAGFCDDLSIYRDGEVVASSCANQQPHSLGTVWLDAAQLEQLYAWVDALQRFEVNRTDPARADGLTLRLVFEGTGQKAATDGQKQSMETFLSDLFDQVSRPAGLPLDPQQGARQALETYFRLLNQGQFSQAVAYFGGSYETLIGYNPDVRPENQALLFERGCTVNGLNCLQVLNVLKSTQTSNGVYGFTVEFANPDGTRFEQGPCCGEDASQYKPITQFDYTVKKVGESYLVMELPPYVP